MKRNILKVTADDFERLRALTLMDSPKEGGAFGLVGSTETGSERIFFLRRPIEIPSGGFETKENLYLRVSAEAVNGLISLAEVNGLGVLVCHSHPFHRGVPRYSPTDDSGEHEIAGTVAAVLKEKVLVSLLFSADKVTGRVWIDGRDEPLDRILVVGTSLVEALDLAGGGVTDEMFSRQVGALGEAGQQAFANLRVGIVGLGGTGSPIAEQLVRLGVNDLTLVDGDFLTRSNVTRVYGSHETDVANPRPRKVEVVAKHLRSIRTGVRVESVIGNVLDPAVAGRLKDRDILFSCTDNHWSRSLLNQLAHQYLIPVINTGVGLDAPDGPVKAGTGIVHVLRPGIPCLWCYEYLSSERIAAESLPPELYASRAKEKYVVGLGTEAPSIISFTTTVGGIAVNVFLQLVTGFMGAAGDIHCLRYDVMEMDLRRGSAQLKTRCICNRAKGRGDCAPLNVCEDTALLAKIDAARWSR